MTRSLLTKTALVIGVALSLATPSIAKAGPTSDLDCLVKVMNHEAGGEGVKGQKAVGYVVANRVRSGRYAPSFCGVVYQKSQFSNIRNAKAVPAHRFNQLKTIAQEILSGYSKSSDPTNGAVNFHARHVSPNWRGMIRTVVIGGHIFYRAR